MSSLLQMSMERPTTASRIQLFFGIFLVLPQCVVLVVLAIGSFLATVAAWFAILVTGKYPQGIWEFNRKSFISVMQLRMYLMQLTDVKPSMSLNDIDEHPLTVELSYPETSSRLKLITAPLGLIPHFVAFMFRLFKMACLMFFGIGILIFTGIFPQAVWDYVFKMKTLSARMGTYLFHMTDERPKNAING